MRLTICVISTLVVGCSFDTSALNDFAHQQDTGIVLDAGLPDLSASDNGHEAAVKSDAMPDDTLLQQDATGDTAEQNDASPDTILPQQDAGQTDGTPPQQDAQPADTLPPPPCDGLTAVFANPGSLTGCKGRHADDTTEDLWLSGGNVGPVTGVCDIVCADGSGNAILPTSCLVQFPTPATTPGCAHLPAAAGSMAGKAGCDYMARCAP